jgi:hypothetical protein
MPTSIEERPFVPDSTRASTRRVGAICDPNRVLDGAGSVKGASLLSRLRRDEQSRHAGRLSLAWVRVRDRN